MISFFRRIFSQNHGNSNDNVNARLMHNHFNHFIKLQHQIEFSFKENAKEKCCVNHFSDSKYNLYFGTGYPNRSYLNPSALNGRRKCVISIIECETHKKIKKKCYRMILLPSAHFIRFSLDIWIMF